MPPRLGNPVGTAESIDCLVRSVRLIPASATNDEPIEQTDSIFNCVFREAPEQIPLNSDGR